MPMSKRNKFEQLNGNLILYPDYGNLKGFVIIGIVAILFCYALYRICFSLVFKDVNFGRHLKYPVFRRLQLTLVKSADLS